VRTAADAATVEVPLTTAGVRAIPNDLPALTCQHGSVSEAVDLATVVSLLDDECARAILVATSTAAMSATELDDDLDASLSTVYRRLERLDDAGLVVEGTRPRADGHHDTVYSADLDEFTVSLADGELNFELRRRREDVAGRLARRWEDLTG
jgi:predicted transcriptional regulator